MLSLIFPSSLLISLLPISVGGWGVREGSLLYFSSIIGIGTEEIVLSSVQFGIILAITGIANSIFIIPISRLLKSK